MSEQLIISIGREYGSGGHDIADELAKRFGLEVYDVNILREIAVEKNLDASLLEKYDEVPKRRFISRNVRGYSNSPEENIANIQFEFLQKKAKEGKSFVVVGRCSETILKDYKGLITIFVLADRDVKIERVSTIRKMSVAEAEATMNRHDRKRKEYHNYYCTGKWGDSRNYDISINSSKLGIADTADYLEQYIKARIDKNK
ncbi:MAG: cytidylate kinase-like family protein [Clostridia bacterium]|jgi:cytidylate kinase|nr:cytidylate kinase-like family protein [Clostridia bacterium]